VFLGEPVFRAGLRDSAGWFFCFSVHKKKIGPSGGLHSARWEAGFHGDLAQVVSSRIHRCFVNLH
jgi:hypothetical protein